MISTLMSNEKYLKPEKFIDSDHPAVVDYATKHVGSATTDVDKAINFYYAISLCNYVINHIVL